MVGQMDREHFIYKYSLWKLLKVEFVGGLLILLIFFFLLLFYFIYQNATNTILCLWQVNDLSEVHIQ